MKNCRKILPAAMAVLGLVANAGETVLWPSALTEMKAQSDSKIARLADGAMGVKTGIKADWPGMRMDFKAGEMDLSAYGRITIAVSNTTAQACTVNLSVKGTTHQGQSPGGSVALEPFQAGEIKVNIRNMPWVLDEPAEIVGMRGYPAAKGGSTFDIRRTHSFHIFFNQKGEPGGFSVKRVAVSGEGVPPKRLAAKTFFPFVDRFGQFRHDEWPGKVHDEAELKAKGAEEEKWLATHATSPIPACDRFGGWTEGPQLKATGSFRTEKVNGKWWLVDPEGRLFFSHGVDCVRTGNETGIGFREKYFEWVPQKDDPVFGKFLYTVSWPQAHGFYKDPAHLPYRAFSFGKANAVRKYGAGWKENQAERAHRRIRAWGLNTIANWSDPGIYLMDRTPYTATFGTRGPVIEGSSGWWGKLRDPFAPEFIANAKASAAAEAKKTGIDPWCIGWFVDNELSWGRDNRDLARAVLRSPAKQPAKKAFRDALARKYGTAERLDAAWGTRYGTWEGFLAATNAVDEAKAGADLEDLHRSLVAQYFRTIRDAIKAVAPNRLYLGTRIAWGANVIYEESARYCDVVSVNIYSRRPTRDLPATAVDKPMINGEFHFGALDRGMFHTGLVGTRDQDERAQCYRDFVNACLDHPRFVGTHWFQWQDQALTGRGDGENYQIGFVTVTDTPYPELVQAARDIGATLYARRWGKTAMRKAVKNVKFVELDPGHFHAALVLNRNYEGVSKDVRVFAPQGPDVEAHRKLVAAFNARPQNPTAWNEIVATGDDYLEKALAAEDRASSVVVLAGRNSKKADYYLEALKAGYNVLSDKPMVITPDAYAKLCEAVRLADEKGLYFADIMTERNEITTILQRYLVAAKDLYGEQEKGTADDPAITKISVHHFCKLVNGKPLQRPGWYYDTDQQGEAIVDVTTHLVDLVQWEAFPGQTLATTDVKMLRARTWATPITAADYRTSTGLDHWPEFLKKSVDGNNVLQCKANGAFTYQLRGVHAKVSVEWHFMPPAGTGDTHYSLMRGTKAEVVIRQGKDEGFRPRVYVKPRAGQDRAALEKALAAAVADFNRTYPGVTFRSEGDGWTLVVPPKYEIGHEAHFSQVMNMYLGWMKKGEQPADYLPNMLVKYYTLAEAWKASR